MPEPTDHRAEAENWFEGAESDYQNYDDHAAGVVPALIGIGHALLALSQPETVEARNIVVPDMRCDTTDDQGHRCTRGALHIMGAAGHHFEQDATPPLSPSEG